MNKLLALAKHLQIDYFEYDNEWYIGVSQEEFNKQEEKLLEKDLDVQEYINEEGYALLEEEIEQTSYDDCEFSYGEQEYLVLTNDEADDRAYDYVYSVWEECYLTDKITKQLGFLANYIDLNQATIDAIKIDGRGHSLAGYDGHESYEEINGKTYYIYRTN